MSDPMEKWGVSVTIDAAGKHPPYRIRHAMNIRAVGETLEQALKSARDHLAELAYQDAEEAREAEAKAVARTIYETMTMGDRVALVKQGTSE